MDFRYLRHLAESGTANIHPGGIGLTHLLINSLNIKKSDMILEIGCGTGETLVRIASQFDVKATGIDFLPEMLNASRKRINFTGTNDKVTVIEHNINNPFPFESNSFDIIYLESALCFHDLPAVLNLLNESHRILKPGAVFAALETIWLSDVKREKANQINSDAERDFGLRPSSNEVLHLENWLGLFKKHGFEIISSFIAVPEKAEVRSLLNYRLFRSKLFTFNTKAKKIFDPVHLKEYLNYRKISKGQKPSGRTMETRLFLIKKKN
jgi:SAM-dependent methyltransferase